MITQNVDRLHQAAGSSAVTELHGTIHDVICTNCGSRQTRASLQEHMAGENSAWLAEEQGRVALEEAQRPDGDVELSDDAIAHFTTPDCSECGGILKPDVVFYGDTVPKDVVQHCTRVVDDADALLVVGSSLHVYSSFRFAKQAAADGKPIAVVTIGETRADPLATLKVQGLVSEVLRDALSL
eukprot:PLAT9984.1.p1 GENE.PLAT9984.1~~PLAT9984.1.p1  ORF type:complete len:183 (+),score=51.08 PLAT9984.1:395-943(+)